MLLNRRTYIAKRGHLFDAVELLRKEVARLASAEHYRVYIPEFGNLNTIACDAEFQDWEEYEQSRQEWEQALSPEFQRKWQAWTERVAADEVWKKLPV